MDHLFCDSPDKSQERLSKIIALSSEHPQKIFRIINKVVEECQRCGEIYGKCWKPVDFENKRKIENLKNKNLGICGWCILHEKSILETFLRFYDNPEDVNGFEGLFLVIFGKHPPETYKLNLSRVVFGEEDASFFTSEKVPANDRLVTALVAYIGAPNAFLISEHCTLVSEMYFKNRTLINNPGENVNLLVFKALECAFLLYNSKFKDNIELDRVFRDAVKLPALHPVFWCNMSAVRSLGLEMSLCAYTKAHDMSSAVLFLLSAENFTLTKEFANLNGLLVSIFDLYTVLERMPEINIFATDCDEMPESIAQTVIDSVSTQLHREVRIRDFETLNLLKARFYSIGKRLVLAQLDMYWTKNVMLIDETALRWPKNMRGFHYLYYLEIFTNEFVNKIRPESDLEMVLHSGIYQDRDVLKVQSHLDIVTIVRDFVLIHKIGYPVIDKVRRLLNRCILKYKSLMYICKHIPEACEIAKMYLGNFVMDRYYFSARKLLSIKDGSMPWIGKNKNETRFKPFKIIIPRRDADGYEKEKSIVEQIEKQKNRIDAAKALVMLSKLSSRAPSSATEYHKAVILNGTPHVECTERIKPFDKQAVYNRLSLKRNNEMKSNEMKYEMKSEKNLVKNTVKYEGDDFMVFATEFLRVVAEKGRIRDNKPSKELPHSFASYDAYQRFFSDISLLEIHSSTLSNAPNDTREHRCRAEFLSENFLQIKFDTAVLNYQDFIAISPSPIKTQGKFKSTRDDSVRYGVVKDVRQRTGLHTGDDQTLYTNQRQGTNGKHCTDQKQQTGQKTSIASVIIDSPKNLKINSVLHCYVLGNLISGYREFVGLLDIKRSDFLPFVLNNSQIVLKYTPSKLLIDRYGSGLNEVQKQIISRCVYSTNKLHLIQGPPGTGKTRTIIGMTREFHMLWPRKRILLCAPSNSAVDELGVRLLDEEFSKEVRVVRTGTTENSRLRPYTVEFLERMENRSKKSIVYGADIVLSTLNTSGSDSLKTAEFSYLIVDEACQATEITTLIPFKNSFEKAILIGDPCQLPPTVFSENEALERSLFERLSKNNAVFLLDTQYRMHPDISRISSDIFYKGLIKSAPSVVQKDLCAYAFAPFYFINIPSGEESVDANNSYFNLLESRYSVELFKKLRCKYKGLKIGLISPYKSQVKVIRDSRAMRESSGSGDDGQVETIDGFQGREADVIIVSTVRRKRLGFLDDPRRINVAITRPRKCLIVLGSAECLKRSTYWKAVIGYCSKENILGVEQFQSFIERL